MCVRFLGLIVDQFVVHSEVARYVALLVDQRYQLPRPLLQSLALGEGSQEVVVLGAEKAGSEDGK